MTAATVRAVPAGAARSRAFCRAAGAVLAFASLAAAEGSESSGKPQVRFTHLGVEDGLSHTTVWDQHQDRRGFVWIATETSLQRYDGYEFINYRHDPQDPASLSASEVMRIHEDRSGRLYFATRQQGVNLYDRTADRFRRFPLWEGVEDIQGGHFITALADDPDGDLWLASHSGLVRLDPSNGEMVRFSHRAADPQGLRSNLVSALSFDRDETLWVGVAGGLSRMDRTSGRFTHFIPSPNAVEESASEVTGIREDSSGRLFVTTDDGTLYIFDRSAETFRRAASLGADVNDLLEAPDGRLWLSTYGNGLFRFDPRNGDLESWSHDPEDRDSLSADNLFRLLSDRSGLLWIGSRDGISIYDPQRSSFVVYRHRHDGDAPAGKNITALARTRRGRVLIGSEDGKISSWHPESGRFEPILTPDGPGLAGILAFHESQSGELWVGERLGLAKIEHRAGETARLVRREDPTGGVAVRTIAEDADGRLWLGTYGLGLVRFDPASADVEEMTIDPMDPQALPSDGVYCLHSARDGRIWVGTDEGLSRLDPRTREIRTWRHDPARRESLAFNQIVDIYEDRAGRLWLATYGGGLDRFDRRREIFVHHQERDGLANNNAVGILEDEAGRLWVSTNQGLSRFDPESARFSTFTTADGIASNVFLIGARTKTGAGRLVFGGHDGLTVFSPGELREDPVAPPVLITDLRVRGESVAPGLVSSPLKRTISETRELELSYRQASFSLELAAPHFANPRENRYAFLLEGYDRDWIETDAASRRARYTNLDAGEYVFRARASNQDGLWNEEGTSLAITIRPPPWKTAWAYGIYACLLLLGVWAYDRSHRHRLERERQISDQLRQVDRLKNEFLANTSHELRTPLYGITGLAESLLDGVHGDLARPAREDLAMIVSSSRRLGGLVNDILDLSRLRDRELTLTLKPVDLASAVELVLTLVRPLVGGKELELRSTVTPEVPTVLADENRLQQILLNLVGNAVKFTESGHVEVAAEPRDGTILISVSDTGFGIEPRNLERIFEAFEQVDAAADRNFGGTGLGLAITRHLVELHGGWLTAESELGVGSHFSFSLPPATRGAEDSGTTENLVNRLREPSLPSAAKPALPLPETAAPAASARTSLDGEAILIVDDEPVVRQVLRNQLSQAGYETLQASSGSEALKILGNGSKKPQGGAESGADLVLLDVMMPRMSGFEVCQEIRRSHSIDDLPIIYLTARSQTEDLVQGFASGANDFLTKPIVQEELLSRVRTHLELLRMHRNLEGLVEARAAQIKTLRGLLPICASCKKIRDDRGYWNELEVYLDAHLEAQLTHGICDTCARDLYPDLKLD